MLDTDLASGLATEIADGWSSGPERLRAWARGTEPSFVYARAIRPAAGTIAQVRELVRYGVATATTRRITGGTAFIVQRLGGQRLRPVLEARSGEGRGPSALPATDEIGRALLRYLGGVAERGEVCPTDAVITRHLGLSTAPQAAYALRKLRLSGHIVVTEPARPNSPRIVRMVASGMTTASYGGAV